MKNTADQFEDEMKQRLQHYEEEPQRDLWGGIEKQIAATNGSGFIRWRLLLLFMAVLVPLAGGYVYNGMKLDSTSLAFSHMDFLKNSLTASLLNLQKSSSVQPIVSKEEVGTMTENVNRVIYSENQIKEKQQSSRSSVIIAPLDERNIETLSNQPQLRSEEGTHSTALGENDNDELTMEDPVQPIEKTVELSILKEDNNPDGVIVRELKNRKHSIYVIAMPTFGYQRIESNPNDNIIIESISRVPAFSIKRLGIRAEIGVEYKISPRLRVFGGLLYYQRKQTIKFTEKQVDSLRITGGNGEVTIEPVLKNVDKSIEYELKNVGVQAGLNYEISKKKFLHVLGTGIELHKPLNKADFNEINLGFGQKPDYYVFYNLYYRLQYPSEGRLRAVFQPSLNYSLYIHQNWNAPFYVKPYGLGLHIGCSYSF